MKNKIYFVVMLISTLAMVTGFFMPFFYIPVFEEGVTLIKISELLEYMGDMDVTAKLSLGLLAVLGVLFVSSAVAVFLVAKKRGKAVVIPSGIVALVLGAMAYAILSGKFFVYGYVTFDAGFWMMASGAVISAILPFTPMNKGK